MIIQGVLGELLIIARIFLLDSILIQCVLLVLQGDNWNVWQDYMPGISTL